MLWKFYDHPFVDEFEFLVSDHPPFTHVVQEVNHEVVQIREIALTHKLWESGKSMITVLISWNQPPHLLSFLIYFLLVLIFKIEDNIILVIARQSMATLRVVLFFLAQLLLRTDQMIICGGLHPPLRYPLLMLCPTILTHVIAFGRSLRDMRAS